ncbi:RING/U-box superfamily protein [Euphorbia peplus]|nr:RING/U-box superfamily protein [Euphorbia peplus]
MGYSLPLQAPSRLEFQVLNNMPQTSSSPQEDRSSSRLSQAEQKNALKKLRKEVYNPIPKRISSRLCLYYRDQASKIVRDMEKEKEEDGKRCAICLEDFEIREMVMMTPCNHMFHEECIVPWVKSHGQCPVCRASIWEPTDGRSSSTINVTNVVPNGDLFGGGDLISILRAMGVM